MSQGLPATNHTHKQGKPNEETAPESHFTEDVVMCWFVQLLMALHHLHSRHIIHRE